MTQDEIDEVRMTLGEMRAACGEIDAYLERCTVGALAVDDAQLAAAIREFGVGVAMLGKVAGGRAAVAPTIPAPPAIDGEPDPKRDGMRLELALDEMVGT